MIKRREFFRLAGITGAGLVLGFRAFAEGDSLVPILENLSDVSEAFDVTPFVNIEKSGLITIMNPRPEMGQGTFQSLPAIIAEELEVSLDKIRIKPTSGESFFGAQTSGGSSSVRTNYNALRKTGASAREMLVKAASQTWNVPEAECMAQEGFIFHKASGKSAAYGDLVEVASKLPVPQNPTLKNPADFKILGKKSARPDIPLKVNGTAVFGIDADVPNMVYASVERSPIIGSKLISFDDSAALKVAGVLKVVRSERILGKFRIEGVAVIAENYWAALQGRKALKIVWDNEGKENFNSKDFNQNLRELSKQEGVIDKSVGDFDKVFAASNKKVVAFYETPIVSHSTMEPMNCTVNWLDEAKCELWVSTQGPDRIKGDISKIFSIPKDNVKVNVLFNGGGFGRRLSADFANEAVFIAKQISKPVKVIWTREDDTQMGPFRPMTFSAFKGAISEDGKVSAFQHKVISPTLNSFQKGDYDKTKVDKTMVEGISEQKYEFPNMKNTFVYAESYIPFSAWRSVTSSTLAFSQECFLDELAHSAQKDTLQFRLDLMTTPSDAKKVLQKLREFSEWDKKLPKNWGRGVAQWEFFAGLAAMVIEVSKVSKTSVKVEKVYCVIDLGTVVNPDNVKAQVEGAVVMGLTAAIKDGITFEKGQTVQKNFNTNRMLRINEMPKVETLILADGGDTIKGVGEPGLPPVAPALANAIFSALGKRVRTLPIDLENIV